MNSAATTTDATTTPNHKQPSQKQKLIAGNVKALIEQLEAGHSDALTAYLNAMSRFHNYSFGNVLEIARQMPDATRVAGFWAWKQLGRSVKSGGERDSHSRSHRGRQAEKGRGSREGLLPSRTRVSWSAFAMPMSFDVSQTEGVELPEPREISGDVGRTAIVWSPSLRSRESLSPTRRRLAPHWG
jgi:hypothetical protein